MVESPPPTSDAPGAVPDDRAPARTADWEAFYASYRKPGYVPGFEIGSKLGGGAFGLVFKATRQSIGKDYAIKFLKVDDTEVRRAVLLELEQVKYFAQIDHPNLVSIEDRGEVDGIPFIVMAYAGAETLSDKLPGDPATRADLLRWFLQACRGVAALHERSLVHFDLKPANVFLKGGVARVGDYGLSKLVTHSRGSLSMGRGTPYYMAPEMLQRRGDARSDIYSLGVMLYEIVCGDVPFKGDSEWEVLRKHEQQAPVFPADLGARERAALERCLAKDPAQRFQGVHELIAALGAPASAGAAAWHDAGAPTGTTPGAPPPRSTPAISGSPPPPKPSDDPYAGFRKAAGEAATHAGKIAREAVANAKEIARKATAQLQQKVREQPWRDRIASVQGWWRTQYAKELARWQARRARRDERRARRAAAREASRARVRGVFGRLVRAVAVLAVVVVVATVWLTPVRSEPGRAATTWHDVLELSMERPAWLPVAAADPVAGKQAIDARVSELRQRALRLNGRDAVANLAFVNVEPVITAAAMADAPEARRRLYAFLADPGHDPDKAEELIGTGADVVRLAAAELALENMLSSGSLERANRLHMLVAQALGVQAVRLYLPEASQRPDEWVQTNRNAARLWQLFVHEFARDAETWRLYREARGLK